MTRVVIEPIKPPNVAEISAWSLTRANCEGVTRQRSGLLSHRPMHSRGFLLTSCVRLAKDERVMIMSLPSDMGTA